MKNAMLRLLLIAFCFALVCGYATAQEDSKQWAESARQTSSAASPEQRERALSTFKQAFELFQGGEFGAAERLFVRGLEIDPANATANFYLGEVYSRQKKGELAEKQYLRTIALARESKDGALAEDRLATIAAAKQATKAQVTVYFMRSSSFFFGGLHISIRDPERGISAIFRGDRDTVYEYKGPPGEISLATEYNLSPGGVLKFELKPESINYFVMKKKDGILQPVLVSEEEGQALLKEIREKP